jgi:hypothetical protein
MAAPVSCPTTTTVRSDAPWFSSSAAPRLPGYCPTSILFLVPASTIEFMRVTVSTWTTEPWGFWWVSELTNLISTVVVQQLADVLNFLFNCVQYFSAAISPQCDSNLFLQISEAACQDSLIHGESWKTYNLLPVLDLTENVRSRNCISLLCSCYI